MEVKKLCNYTGLAWKLNRKARKDKKFFGFL